MSTDANNNITEIVETLDKQIGAESQLSDQAVGVVDLTDEAEMTKRAKHHKKWNRRFKIFFCCLGYKKNKDSIADVASIFAEFYADLDVPSSDIAAGFVLLSKYQTAQRQWIVSNHELGVDQYLSTVPITAQTNFLDISTAQDSHLINDLIYYMNYSLAIFGWPMQMIDDPCMLCCIFPYLKLSRCCGGSGKRRQRRAALPKTGSKEVKEEEERIKSEPTDRAQKTIGESELSAGLVDSSRLRPSSSAENIDQIRSRQSTPGKLNDDCDIPIILEDNCCGCNVASVERRLAAHNYEIVYVNYRVNVNVVPFLVAADHSKQTVVVAMRGSMSLSDMVTDMNGQVDKLPIDGCPDDWLSHRGITRAANYVKQTLINERILDRAYNCRPDLGSQDYKLVLCGHSLGAGVAAILGILMRKDFPTLKAYLYSPPGGILSLPAVEYTKEFATGIILGNDCVARLGVAQLERLRYQVLLSLKSSEKSTGKILAKALCPTCCLGGNKVDYDPNQSLNLLHGTEARSFNYNGNKIPFQVQPQVLYVPGRLIHIVKNYTFKSKARRLFNGPIYQAIWNENTLYDRILISDGMLYDHLPNNLMHAMKMLFSKTLPARKDLTPNQSASSITTSPSPSPWPSQVTCDLEETGDNALTNEQVHSDEGEGVGDEKKFRTSKRANGEIVIVKGENNGISPANEVSELDGNNNSKVISRFEGEHKNPAKNQKGTQLDESLGEDADQKSSFDLNGNEESVLDRNL